MYPEINNEKPQDRATDRMSQEEYDAYCEKLNTVLSDDALSTAVNLQCEMAKHRKKLRENLAELPMDDAQRDGLITTWEEKVLAKFKMPKR